MSLFYCNQAKTAFTLSMRAIKIEKIIKITCLLSIKGSFSRIRFHVSGMRAIDFSHKNIPKILDFEKNFRLQNPVIYSC